MPVRFIDTNVLVYLASADARKAEIARRELEMGGMISVQVLNELANVARRKMKLTWPETYEFLALVRDYLRVKPLTTDTHDLGMSLAAKHSLSLYDSLIVASALLAGCDTLLSEDMQDGFVVADQMVIHNQFAAGF